MAPSRRDSRVCDFRVCYFLRLVFPAMRFPRLRPSHPMLKPAFPCAHSNSIYFSLPGLLPYFLSNALTRRFPGFRISEISLRFRRVISLSSCLTILLVMRVFSLSPLTFLFHWSTCIIHDLCCLELTPSLIVFNYYSIT